MTDPVIRFTIQFAQHSRVGSAEIGLLEAIHTAGSLSQAARDLQISYRHAWLLLAGLNRAFRSPVALAKRGGNGGGGACLTRLGESLVVSYRALEQEFAQVAAGWLQSIAPMAAGPMKQLREAATMTEPTDQGRQR
jgi:molybdate transport system regulatory protein